MDLIMADKYYILPTYTSYINLVSYSYILIIYRIYIILNIAKMIG